MRNLLSKGANRKLGKNVFCFNLPVIGTCPGSSSVCRSACYARPGQGYFGYHQKRYLDNLQDAEALDFAERMCSEIRRRKVKRLRIHSSGDFYSVEYIRKWRQVLMASRLKAWAYTRSWRVPELLVELKYLAALPNMQLQFSTDVETGLPPLVRGVKVNFLQVQEELMQDSSGRVDLVFREKQVGREPAKRLALPMASTPALICPNYQGTELGKHITCEECGFCVE